MLPTLNIDLADLEMTDEKPSQLILVLLCNYFLFFAFLCGTFVSQHSLSHRLNKENYSPLELWDFVYI